MVSHHTDDIKIPQLIVKDINRSLIRLLGYFAPRYPLTEAGIDPRAKVHTMAKLGNRVRIGAYTVIEEGVVIGDDTDIGEGCKIERNCKIGENSRLDSHVIIYQDCILGSHVILQANTVIGSVGFGYIYLDRQHQLVPHIGDVIIEDYVEIGANCCVDRAKFDSTYIGAGTKLDNLVQVGHNVTIGRCCLIVALTGIGGSCHIGNGVVVAGQVGICDHANIGDGSQIGAKSLVTGDLKNGAKVFGIPAYEKTKSLRTTGLTKRLPELFSRLRKMEQTLKESISKKGSSKK